MSEGVCKFRQKNYFNDWTVLRHDVLCEIFGITTIMLIAVVAGNVCDALEEAGISDVFVPDIRGCRSQAAQISSLASSHGGAERIGCDEDESKNIWNIFFTIF